MAKANQLKLDEILFIKVEHNRGRDILQPKVWVFGLYERATANEPKLVRFFKVDSRDAVTLLNIIYNHVLPGTIINSDWGNSKPFTNICCSRWYLKIQMQN